MADKQPADVPVSGPFNLLRPLLLMSYATMYLPPTIFNLLISFKWSTFFSLSAFKDAWFARFWVFFGPKSREMAAPKVMPLLQQNAKGVCLDIGPGSGQWVYLFGRANNPAITKIYGIEPNRDLHKDLRENAVKAGIGEWRLGCFWDLNFDCVGLTVV